MLSGLEIKRLFDSGDITISPFDPTQVNTNSYDLRLAKKIQTYKILDAPESFLVSRARSNWHTTIDIQNPPPMLEEEIREDGYLVYPGRLYLCSTVEKTYSPKHIPVISGKASVKRFGIEVVTGIGAVGFNGHWAFEIKTTHPTVLYPHMRVAQIFFMPVEGEIKLYDGRYQNQGEKPIEREENR